jgi:hypothetical protein
LDSGGFFVRSSDIGSLQSESDRNLSLPHDRPLSTPHGIFAALAMTDRELAHLFLRVALDQRRRATIDQIASMSPKGQAP